VTGRGGVILSTSNGGTTWSLQSSGTTNDLIGLDCPGTTVCFTVGYSGTILALPPGPLPPVPPPPWWNQPANPPALAPSAPWYRTGVASSPHAVQSVPLPPSTQGSVSPSGSPLPVTRQGDVYRVFASQVEQIANKVRAIFMVTRP
jgi:hypothetical protein